MHVHTINTYFEDFPGLCRFIDENRDSLYSESNSAILVQIFSGICEHNFLESLLMKIKELLPQAQIIGTTTSGEIMNGKVSALNTVLSFSIFKNSTIKTFLNKQSGKTSFELGQSIAEQIDDNLSKVLILFSTGQTVNGQQLLKGIESINPKIPVAGGIAGDNFINQKSFVLSNEGITDCGTASAILSGKNLSIDQHWHLCWIPIGKEMTITKADGVRVYTIDNIPAYQVYQNYLGFEEKSSSIINSIFPLMSSRHGVEIVRVPSHVYDDDSIDFLEEMAIGKKVRFSYAHVDMILDTIDSLIREISDKSAESIFVYSCALRRGFLQDSSEIETLPLQQIASTSGFFTNGEFYHIDNTNQLLMATMTTLTLSESVKDRKSRSVCRDNPVICDSPIKDNVSFRNIEILKALTNLVNTVTRELSERTLELEKINYKIEYNSTHDALTGLYNRFFYDRELEKMNASNNSLGIVICDVDGLKLINDTLGHSLGDITLKATSNILKSLVSANAIPARLGGDEFSIILPETLQENLEQFCRNILSAVTEYNSTNPLVPLSISVGSAYRDNAAGKIQEILKEADSTMYRTKLHQSKIIRNTLVRKMIQSLEEKDFVTEKQIVELQNIVTKFAEKLNLEKNIIQYLRLFARYHDIGKVGIPDSILFKPGTLTRKEETEMRRHCEIGFRIAQSSPEFINVADGILKHQEWWNGQGYPLGLEKEAIPLECRIMSIAAAYAAMTNDRPYRKAMNRDSALSELRLGAGTQFDPSLVEVFIAILE